MKQVQVCLITSISVLLGCSNGVDGRSYAATDYNDITLACENDITWTTVLLTKAVSMLQHIHSFITYQTFSSTSRHQSSLDVSPMLYLCRAVLVDRPSFLLLYVARTDLGMPMDAIFGDHPGWRTMNKGVTLVAVACDWTLDDPLAYGPSVWEAGRLGSRR